MSTPPIWYLVTYDVRDPKRLRKVAKLLEGYGHRVQFSVFRIRLNRESIEKMRWELAELMTSEDDLLVIPLCERCASKVSEHSRGDRSDWGNPPPSFEII